METIIEKNEIKQWTLISKKLFNEIKENGNNVELCPYYPEKSDGQKYIIEKKAKNGDTIWVVNIIEINTDDKASKHTYHIVDYVA